METNLAVDEQARRSLAKQALESIRALAAANFPIDKFFPDGLARSVNRQAGDSWPQTFCKKLNLELPELHSFVLGILDTGWWARNELALNPTADQFRRSFETWAALLIQIERELKALEAGQEVESWLADGAR